MTHDEAREVAGRLTDRQKAALLAYPNDTQMKMADATVHYSRAWVKAREIGAAGSTMVALQTVGGIDPDTFLPGPCLAKPDWSREGCHWALTDDGMEVRRILQENRDGE